jgi:anthranilate phosphoribosyltransferase
LSLADHIDRLLAGDDLGRAGAAEALDAVMGGQIDPIQTAAFLIALRAKGETARPRPGTPCGADP